MNAISIINNALLARGLAPVDGYVTCPCCGDDKLTRDDLATEAAHNAAYIAKLEVKYGAKVCKDCADLHETCERCDEAVHDEKARSGPSGERCCFICAEVLYLDVELPPKDSNKPATRLKCYYCRGAGDRGSEYHYVRGHGIRNECDKCDGRGYFEAAA